MFIALQITSYYLYPHLLSAAVTMQTWAAHSIERERESACLASKMGFGRDLRNSTRVWWSCRTGSWSCWRRWSASWPCGWRAIRNMHRFCSTSVSRWQAWQLLSDPLRQYGLQVMAHSWQVARVGKWSWCFIFRTSHSATCSLCICLAFSISVYLFVCFSHSLTHISYPIFLYLGMWFLLSVVDSHGSADGAVEQDHEVPRWGAQLRASPPPHNDDQRQAAGEEELPKPPTADRVWDAQGEPLYRFKGHQWPCLHLVLRLVFINPITSRWH